MGNCVQLPGAQPPLTLLKCCTVWPSAGGREAKQVCHGTTHALAIYKFKLFCRALEAVLGGTDSPKHLPVFCARRHAERLAYALTATSEGFAGGGRAAAAWNSGKAGDLSLQACCAGNDA
eukprot:366383-Chlamydomonas_euryale.AAC.8